MAVSFDRQTLHFPRRFAPNQILSSFRLCVMDVFKLRIFCLPGTVVLCNGFRIMHWRETWYSRLLCPMWLQDVDWKGHLQVFIGGAVGRYWVTSGKLCLSRTKASGSLAGLLVIRFLEKNSVDLPIFMYFPCKNLLEKTREFRWASVHKGLFCGFWLYFCCGAETIWPKAN